VICPSERCWPLTVTSPIIRLPQYDHHDAYYYNNTPYDAFDSEDEREYEWRNPYTNNYGYVTPGDYHDDGYQGYEGPCREFSQRVFIDGRRETAYGVACRQPDGSWRIVSGN
jgi:surface antigen